jgi:hypothetical protein
MYIETPVISFTDGKNPYDTLYKVVDTSERFMEFERQMKTRIVEFSFKKKDGTIREAKGTMSKEIRQEHGDKWEFNKDSNYTYNSTDQYRYYDIDKEAWRSFRKEQFIDFKD